MIDDEHDKLSRRRLFGLLILFLGALFLLSLRLGYLQIFKSKDYLGRAKDQSRVTIELQPARGRILDRNGRFMALDVRPDSLYAESRIMKDKQGAARKIAKILGVSYESVYRRIQKDKGFVWIARKISEDKVKAIKALKIAGLGFVNESQRVYPKGQLACHIIGFTDIDNNGLEGVELQYNSFLKGVPGWKLGQRDAKQRELPSKQLEMVPPVDGFDVHLTLDEVIQAIAEKHLDETCKKFNAKNGSIIVMDPATGDILGLANWPLYDLSQVRHTPAEYRKNRAITDVFEPGSVFKVFTMCGALENGTAKPSDKFNCEGGSWPVAGKILHDVHGYGILTFKEVIEKSSNIGTVKIALKLGADKVYKTIRDFGFGSRTGILLAGEVAGILPHTKNWSRSSIINIPIGQGIALTSMQLCTAVAAVANDGMMMRPRIITRIDDSDGKAVQTYDIKEVRQVVSKETALQARTILEGVVAKGTGKKAAVKGFKAAGKTGTAQKILPGGGYSHDHFIASFVGFIPYDEPQLVITVSIDEPHPIYYGGDVAAPAFAKVAADIMDYWQVNKTLETKNVSAKSR